MSLQNHIKSLFKMQDILFLEEAFSTIEKKGVIYQLWNAISTTSVSISPHCRGIHLVRNGTYQKKILLSKCFGYPILLLVKQQRYLCRDCNKTKSAELQGVEKYCNISLNLKLAILFALQQKQSMTAIAKEYGVSVTTVQRFLDTCYQQEYIPRELPEVLCIDEFSSTKDSSGSMSCTLLNGETHEIVDILENRQLSFLEDKL